MPITIPVDRFGATPGMAYGPLGRTGPLVSRPALGTWRWADLGIDAVAADALIGAQDGCHLLDRRYDLHTLPAVRRFGLGCLAFSPLAGGVPSSRFLADAAPDPSGRDAARRADLAAQPRVQALLAASAERARMHGCTLESFALAMILARPGITSAIVGARTSAQPRSLGAACAVAIGPEDERVMRSPGQARRAHHPVRCG